MAVKINLNISNKVAYTFIAILVILSVSLIVYALTPGVAPNPGHVLTQVAPPSPCATGQVITWNGANLVCGNAGAGFTTCKTRYRIHSGGSQANVYCESGWKMTGGGCSAQGGCATSVAWGGYGYSYTNDDLTHDISPEPNPQGWSCNALKEFTCEVRCCQ